MKLSFNSLGEFGFLYCETAVFLVTAGYRLSFDIFMLEMVYSLTEIFKTFSAPCLSAFRKQNKAAFVNSICVPMVCLPGGREKGYWRRGGHCKGLED